MEKPTDSDRIVVTSPHFASDQEARQWHRSREAAGARTTKKLPKVDEIDDATTYLLLASHEKRVLLRAALAQKQPMPRPREGSWAVDALLIPLLDEEVGYEVLRRLAETDGDMQRAAKMENFESRKPVLARLIREARARGDGQAAQRLCEEMNSLSVLTVRPAGPDANPERWDVRLLLCIAAVD